MIGTGYMWFLVETHEMEEWQEWRKEGDKREGSWRKERNYFYLDFNIYVCAYNQSIEISVSKGICTPHLKY